ncbi:MAG: MBL fold metallo-hydrolase [Rhodobacteraceae bacterium]|nr:MBL fold metallo-hydrolase [Paracoccaceae bacterium]MCZ8083884.1 MBL fold metallo-hydrolase [Paracoccaceae bacterium]
MPSPDKPFPRPDSQPRLRTILAPNAAPLTFRGTNTYILGSGRVAVIDPGPDLPAHLDAILAALDQGEAVSHILVTHPHRDHSALAPALAAATGAPILAFGTATEGRSPLMQNLAAAGLTAGGDGLDLAFLPHQRLRDGETLTGPDWQVTALHTPGHLGSHLCFSAGAWLFSGDHVMGWSSSVISPPDGDMRSYMEALHRIDRPDWALFLPGHGDPIPNPRDRVRTLITHRRDREAQIVAALSRGPADAETLTRQIYTDLPPALLPAARQNVLAHLLDLQEKNHVSAPTPLHPTARFHLI